MTKGVFGTKSGRQGTLPANGLVGAWQFGKLWRGVFWDLDGGGRTNKSVSKGERVEIATKQHVSENGHGKGWTKKIWKQAMK